MRNNRCTFAHQRTRRNSRSTFRARQRHAYILYHIIMAIIVACLLIACLVIRYLKMRYPRPHFRYNNDTLYGLAALMFGFEVFIIYSLIHKLIERCYETPRPRLSDVQPTEETPTAPYAPNPPPAYYTPPSRLPPTAQNWFRGAIDNTRKPGNLPSLKKEILSAKTAR